MFSIRASIVARTGLKRCGLATVSDAQTPSFRIPLIDFARFTRSSPSEKKNVALEIVSAFKESGFIYLSGHGIPARAYCSFRGCGRLPTSCSDHPKYIHKGNSSVSSYRASLSTFRAQSADFFRMPMDLKQRLAWEDPRSNRGYVKIGRERVTQARCHYSSTSMFSSTTKCGIGY
jgi:isopenicillin N synthase-like dioxygenase